MVQFPETLDRYSTSELYKRFGEPEPEAVARLDSKSLSDSVPTHHVFIPGWFGVPSDDIVLGEERISLSDFGESFNPHKSAKFSSKTLPLLQPPETRFSNDPLSFASDIWTLACTIWEVFGQRPLFEAFLPTADRVIAEQVEVLGVLPAEWWGKWDRRSEWFNEEGELDPKQGICHDGVHRAWDHRFDYCIQEPRAEVGMEIVTEKERRAFEVMLRSMLVFRPEGRATAQQILGSEWMKGWGEPALERSWSTVFHSATGREGHEADLRLRLATTGTQCLGYSRKFLDYVPG